MKRKGVVSGDHVRVPLPSVKTEGENHHNQQVEVNILIKRNVVYEAIIIVVSVRSNLTVPLIVKKLRGRTEES